MSTILDTALDYIARGWAPVPILYRKKRPILDNWPGLRVTTETAPRYFNGDEQNIGIILGPGGVTDLDLDCPEAIAAAPYLLSRTATFGHASKRVSHYIYKSNLAGSETRANKKFMSVDKLGMLEVRTGGKKLGSQTVFPPSTHESGEPIAWEDARATIREVDGAELLVAAARLAAATQFALAYPKVGMRHEASFVLGGFLFRCGFSLPEIGLFVEAVAAASGQPLEKRRDMVRTARDAAQRGKPAGFPQLAETFGERAAEKCAEWLGYKGGEPSDLAASSGAEGAPNEATTGKAKLPVPRSDAEAGPVMRAWDDILSAVAVPEPPMRDVEGWPVFVERRGLTGLHELTAGGANDDEEEISRLPSPRFHLLTRHDRESLELLLSDHLTLVKISKDGERAVAPPSRFLNHYLKYRTQSNLPRVLAVQTMPLILPDGTLLAANGLDRQRRAVFRIEPELLPYVPAPEHCAEEAVFEAFDFLAENWLCDVETSLEGKCILIALALTIIERILLPQRPLFFVTAGLRGGGKTTVLRMIATAVLGATAPAAAWSADVAERRKAVFAYLLDAVPFLIWDNIPRGTLISCPHIEAAATSETYCDRVLGESRTPTAPAYTIMSFTGNNIAPKADQASRSLEVRIQVDRPDPENREFLHPDPIGWTQDHRGQILGALFTVMLGNPQLDRARRRAPETRFKEWWHLVGSAVENASKRSAGRLAEPISTSFKQMFARTEAKDEEAIERADIVQTLYDLHRERDFTAIELHGFLEESRRKDTEGMKEDSGVTTLRQFCTSRSGKVPSVKSISLALQAIADAPVAMAGGVAMLRTIINTDSKQKRFAVEVMRRD